MPTSKIITPATALGLNLLIGDRPQRNLVINKLLDQHPTETKILSQRNDWGSHDDQTFIQPFTTDTLSKILENQRQKIEKNGKTSENVLRVILDNPLGLSMLYQSNGPLQILIHSGRSMNITTIIATPIIPVFHQYIRRSYILPLTANYHYTLLGEGVFEDKAEYRGHADGNLLIIDYPDEGAANFCKIPLKHLTDKK